MAEKPYSVQKVGEVEPQIGGLTLPITFITSSDVAPEWCDSLDRDAFLRNFWKKFGNDMLQAVLATVIAKVQTQNWELEGPKALATMYHRLIRDESDRGRGYSSLVARGLLDYYTQDNGWFMERLRSGPKDYDGPCLGFAHLDSGRMYPTGNDEYPYAYQDVWGEYHLMHRSQFIRIVDMPTSETQLYSSDRGFCALSRTLSTALILTMLVAMKRERLADLPPSALAIFNNINRKQFENSLRINTAENDMKNNMIYRQLLPLFGVDPAHPASVSFISLREVWEGYDDQTAMDIAAYSFAAGFRIDPREFWPVSQGPLGTGKEAEVQHQKAKAKSHGLIFTEIERAWNAGWSLPDRLTFRYRLQDIDEEEQKANILRLQIGNLEGMQKAGAGLSAQEVRFMLVNEYKALPKMLMRVPEEGDELDVELVDVYMDDVERQTKEFGGWWFGPTVRIDERGIIERVGHKSLPEDVMFVDLDAIPIVDHKGGLRGGSAPRAGIGAAMSLITGPIAAERQVLARQRGKVEYSTTDFKHFTCCSSHANQLFPDLVNFLAEKDYLDEEHVQRSSFIPEEEVWKLARSIGNIKEGGKSIGIASSNSVMSLLAASIIELGKREYELGTKETSALRTINQKIATLPGPVANQVRKASADLKTAMSGKDRMQAILDIPDEVWDEAVRRDILDEQEA